MKAPPILFVFLMLIILSCTRSKKDLIVGTWKGVTSENTAIDSFAIKSQHFIDTMGNNNTPDENNDFYGTYNMDSLRQALQLQYDSAFTIQKRRVTHTIFQFTKGRIAYLSFNSNVTIDTAKWNFDDEGALILEDISQGGNRAVKRMEIITITDSTMQLKIWSNNDSSKVIFRHVTE